MLRLKICTLIFSLFLCFNCKNDTSKNNTSTDRDTKNKTETVNIIPINHATLVLETEKAIFYVDPVGGAEAFKGQKKPDIVLITDIHGDHLSKKTLESLDLNDAIIIAPQAVVDKIPGTIAKTLITLTNDSIFKYNSMEIEAIPMYNLREEALKYHEKGRGNGYVININDKRIYISGDTEDIPEMRNLKNIDKALICMNLPYTMTVESAASAVLDFKPRQVIPYHFRGSNGFSDIGKFKRLVEQEEKTIEVTLLKWY